MTTTTDTSNSYLSSLYGASSSSSSTNTAATGSDTIDQAGFLKLLTAQMTMQDPTAPMDSNTMVQQMSQMSEVQGITEMNSSMKSLLSEVQGNRIGDAASWIGKAALLSSSTAQPLTNGGYAGEITLPSDATSMNVSLVDSSGKTVYSQALTNQKAGTIDFPGTARWPTARRLPARSRWWSWRPIPRAPSPNRLDLSHHHRRQLAGGRQLGAAHHHAGHDLALRRPQPLLTPFP